MENCPPEEPEKHAKRRGPKPDQRTPLDVRVHADILDALEGIERLTGLPPDQGAAMLLHLLIRDPENVVARLKAFQGEARPEPTGAADERPTLIPRRTG